MTIDQTLTLLAIMVWPFVAVVVCVTLVHVARMIVEALVDYRKYIKHEASFATSRWIELWSSVLQSTLPALVRAVANDQVNSTKPNVESTAERALLALIASNGGIPGRPKDETVRCLVHEVRKLYDELEHPTEPVSVDGGDGGRDDDDLVSELFGSSFTDEDLDEDDGDTRGATAVMDEEI